MKELLFLTAVNPALPSIIPVTVNIGKRVRIVSFQTDVGAVVAALPDLFGFSMLPLGGTVPIAEAWMPIGAGVVVVTGALGVNNTEPYTTDFTPSPALYGSQSRVSIAIPDVWHYQSFRCIIFATGGNSDFRLCYEQDSIGGQSPRARARARAL